MFDNCLLFLFRGELTAEKELRQTLRKKEKKSIKENGKIGKGEKITSKRTPEMQTGDWRHNKIQKGRKKS